MTRTITVLALTALLVTPALADPAEIYYAPETRLDLVDIELISEATTTLDIAAYVLTDDGVIEALDAAAIRGVKVRAVLDPREHSRVDLMIGLEVRKKAGGALQHLKSFEIDGTVLRTGSANFSHSGETMQDNDLVVLRDRTLAANFEADFERIWQAAVPVESIGRPDQPTPLGAQPAPAVDWQKVWRHYLDDLRDHIRQALPRFKDN